MNDGKQSILENAWDLKHWLSYGNKSAVDTPCSYRYLFCDINMMQKKTHKLG